MAKEKCDCGNEGGKDKVKDKVDYMQYLLLAGIFMIIFLIVNKKC